MPDQEKPNFAIIAAVQLPNVSDVEFEVARLRRRNLVVDEENVDAAASVRLLRVVRFAIDEAADFLALADAQIRCLVEARTLLDEGLDDREAQCLGQIAQFGERRLELDVADVRQLYGSDDREF